MKKDAKIFIAGHCGLVGSALMRNLKSRGYSKLLTCARSILDLTSQDQVSQFFSIEKPEYVFLAAAKVGGIYANTTYPAEFIYSNLAIQTNVIHAAYENKVTRLLFLGSSCIYPKLAAQPMKEEYLLTGMLEPTNRPYAIAKIAGIEQCWAYNRQYGTKYLAVMPTNLYGPNDNYDLHNSHVLPALIRKFHEAKQNNSPFITLWGTGTARREFLYSNDMAEACILLMNLPETQFEEILGSNTDRPPLINIGCGEDVTVRELAGLIARSIGYSGAVLFDAAKPDGTPRKLLDISRLTALGWFPKISLLNGIQFAYEDYLQRSNELVSVND